MTQAEAGKGSRPRPFSVSHEEWVNRWDAIFGRDLKENTDAVVEDQNPEETESKNGK